MLILIILAGCSTSPGNSNSAHRPIIGFPANSPEAWSFITKINNAGYPIFAHTNFVISADGLFYV